MKPKRDDLKPGDKVRTMAGCRINGPPGDLIVVETGHRWRNRWTVTCRKPDGSVTAFLEDNLVKVNE